MHEPEPQPWEIKGWTTFWIFVVFEAIVLALLFLISR